MTDGLEALQQAEDEARAWAEYESIIGVSRVRSDEMPHPDGTLHTLEERARARAIVEEAVRATERVRAAALVEAAQRFKAANEALTRLHEREAVDATNTDAEWAGLVADAWFEHDRARDALYAALAAYQGGASA